MLPTEQLWHAVPPAEVVQEFHSDAEEGLTRTDAEERFRTVGPNTIAKGKGVHPLVRFLLQFNNLSAAKNTSVR